MIALLFIILSLPLAWSQEFKFYRVGNLKIIIHQVDGMWVNKSCENKKCLAFVAGKKNLDKAMDSKLLLGGKNPRAVRCKTVLNGVVVIALDKNGNQQSLCQFTDDSYLK